MHSQPTALAIYILPAIALAVCALAYHSMADKVALRNNLPHAGKMKTADWRSDYCNRFGKSAPAGAEGSKHAEAAVVC